MESFEEYKARQFEEHTAIADRIMGNYLNGNKRDAVDILFSLSGDARIAVPLIIGRDYRTSEVCNVIVTLYAMQEPEHVL